MENKLNENFQMLDSGDIDVKLEFQNQIKFKSLNELISLDNKLFTEIKNLESEKYSLVAQNYKKFISATETINNVYV